MITRLHRLRHHRIVIPSIIIAICLCGTSVIIASGKVTQAGGTFGSAPTPAVVLQSRAASGLTLTLESVDATASETQLTFKGTLPPKIAASTADRIMGPMFAPSNLVLQGISMLPNGLDLAPQSRHPGDSQFAFTMTLGPVTVPTSSILVSFPTMRFQMKPNDLNPVSLSGPWNFTVPSSAFAANQPNLTQANPAQTSIGGITIHLDRIENQASGLSVYYTISSSLPQPIQPIIPSVWLAFSDGSRSQPAAMQAQTNSSSDGAVIQGGEAIQPNQPRQFVSVFPPLAKSGGNATLEFSDFLTTIDQPASITIQNPFGQWSSSPVMVQGETFNVSKVDYDVPTQTLTIAVDNQEPIAQANVMFLGVGPQQVTATDAQGQSYPSVSGSTGMRRQSDQLMGAGETVMVFQGIPPQTSQLTVTASASGQIIRGTWSIPVTLP